MKTKMKRYLYFATLCFGICFGSCSLAAGGISIPLKTAASADGKTLDSLEVDLESAKILEDKLEVLKRIAALNDAGGKRFLLEYYRNLPPFEYSSNPGGNYYLKVCLFDSVLPLLDGKERGSFLYEVMQSEVKKLREAESLHVGNKYPGTLWRKTLKLMESDGLSPDMLGILSAVGDDVSIPEDARSVFKTCVVRQDFGSNSGEVVGKIRGLLEKFPVKPVENIPWDIYCDVERRIAYCGSPEYKNRLAEFDKWRQSGELDKFETDKRVLLSYGIASIEQIVAFIARDDVSKERRDCLAMVAAKVLSALRGLSSQERETLSKLVGQLERYVDQMEDKGAFSFRSDAIVALKSYYGSMGIKEPHQFKEGRRTIITGSITSNVTTNR